MALRPIRSTLGGLARLGVLAVVLAASPAFGQVPQPLVPDVVQRSGLYTHFEGIEPVLPQDPNRDIFYDTRWADYPQVQPHVNCYKHNGIYGLPWGGDCTACKYPFFAGSPGASTLSPNCHPKHYLSRWVQNFVHPFKPVGFYYAGGCYSPIYDLDPLVTGPGPFPWSHLLRIPKGG